VVGDLDWRVLSVGAREVTSRRVRQDRADVELLTGCPGSPDLPQSAGGREWIGASLRHRQQADLAVCVWPF
jgi:hypothetical protein